MVRQNDGIYLPHPELDASSLSTEVSWKFLRGVQATPIPSVFTELRNCFQHRVKPQFQDVEMSSDKLVCGGFIFGFLISPTRGI